MAAIPPPSDYPTGDSSSSRTVTTGGELEPNEGLVIVSMMLQDFYENNNNDTVLTSGKILMTLLQNAIKKTTDPKKKEMYRKIRLTNPKIKQHVVQVDTALDLLGLAGFEQQGNGEFLVYNPQQKHRNALELYLQEEDGGGEGNAIIDAICSGLKIKIKEIESVIASNSSSSSSPKKTNPLTASAASTSSHASNNNNNDSSSPFLSEEERAKRAAKIKAMKKAKKAQREAAVERWKENMDEKKEAAQRREAMLTAKVEADAKENGLASNITVSSSKSSAGVLPKPFEDPKEQLAAAARARAERNNKSNNNLSSKSSVDRTDPQAIRRQLIQETMKDSKLNPKEKQSQVQRIMKMGTEELLATTANNDNSKQEEDRDGMDLAGDNTAATSAAAKKEEGQDDDEKMEEAEGVSMEEDEEQNKKPAAAATPKLPTSYNNDDLITARAPAPPSLEWKKFVENVPRCAGAEGIRESSVFGRHQNNNSTMSVPQCLKRLFKELDGLKDALPSDPNCSIWLRFDEETPQYIRALVTAPLPGPTPYSGGLFAFDIYVPNDYPQSNPKVQLITTGGGTVRFGPNLYADGKVCLSLLGTWSGPKWNPKHSSLYQVLISIQGLILGVEHPYYLEPGHGGWEGNVKEGDFQVKGQSLSGKSIQQEVGVPTEVILYEDELRVGSVKFSMVQHLRWALQGSANTNGLEAFTDIIQAHFSENKTGILAEVRTWMSDQALGRKRDELEARVGRGAYKLGIGLGVGATKEGTSQKKKKLRIDELQNLFPKLEALLDKASIPTTTASTLKSPPPPPAPAAATDDNAMETEEEEVGSSKPPANPSTKRDKEQEDTSTKRNKTESLSPAVSPAGDVDVVEQKRQQMQQAAANGDYVLAGRLQEEVKRLEELQRGMQEAAQQNDFIRAGRLQAQFKALTATDTTKATSTSGSAKPATATAASSSAWNDDEDEEMFDEENDDEDDMDEDMGMGMAGGGPPFALGSSGMPHGLGKNVFAPPGYNQHLMNKHHSWGSGNQLGNTTNPPSAAATAIEPAKKKAAVIPKKSIPPGQLCRLRIRLPQDKSVVEDFDKNDTLGAVYRRVELQMPEEERKKSALVGPAAAGGGAFSQPLSSAGFTLLLTRPKREFSLEMHGTKSLLDLNLAPSATLTVMRCSDRGITKRGEVESRLEGAQGDAIDVEGLSYEALTELTERVGKAGPKEGSSFLTLTVEEFEENTEKFSPSSYLADLEDSMEEVTEDQLRCPVCLGSYDKSDTSLSLRKIKTCGHIMHGACLQTWLRTNSSCPLCKSSIKG